MTAPHADAALLEELRAIYGDADALYAGASCPSSTECCRFGITGREPHVTSIEVLAVMRAVAQRGGPLGRNRRALPLAAGGPDEGTCPLLDRQGRCAVYAARPLGCRTFYCERASLGAAPPREALRELVRRIQALAARHRAGGERPRTLRRALGERGG